MKWHYSLVKVRSDEDGWWGHQPWRPRDTITLSCCQKPWAPMIPAMVSIDGWWGHQPWRPRDTNHGDQEHQQWPSWPPRLQGFCYSPFSLLPTSFLPPSSLVRTLFGPRSELLRKTPEQGPNEVRRKEDGEWNESGTRVEQEYKNSIQDNKKKSF